MKFPQHKANDQQLPLWEQPLGNHGTVRTTLGDFVEELTAMFFHGKRFRTDSTADYCPDVLFGEDIYAECKSAGSTNQTFVYAGRLERDREFAKQYELVYVIWHHRAPTKQAGTEHELRCLFLKCMRAIYVVPFAEIDRITSKMKIEKLNSKYKYGISGGSKFYGSGYRIPLKSIRQGEHVLIEFNHRHQKELW